MKDRIFNWAIALIIPTVLVSATAAVIHNDIQNDRIRQSTAVLVWESK